MNAVEFQKKSDAVTAAKKLRAAGIACKVFRRSGVYAQPGRGVVSFVNYFIKTAG